MRRTLNSQRSRVGLLMIAPANSDDDINTHGANLARETQRRQSGQTLSIETSYFDTLNAA